MGLWSVSCNGYIAAIIRGIFLCAVKIVVNRESCCEETYCIRELALSLFTEKTFLLLFCFFVVVFWLCCGHVLVVLVVFVLPPELRLWRKLRQLQLLRWYLCLCLLLWLWMLHFRFQSLRHCLWSVDFFLFLFTHQNVE